MGFAHAPHAENHPVLERLRISLFPDSGDQFFKQGFAGNK